jgi:uncharacterized membrane protein
MMGDGPRGSRKYLEDGNHSLYGGAQNDLLNGGLWTNVVQQDATDQLISI